MTRFKPIPGYPDYYINRLGVVMSYKKYAYGIVLKAGLASSGYLTVALGRGHTKLVHELVAIVFIGERPNGFDVAHKDGNKTNNRVDNLEYKSRTDNNYDFAQHGRTRIDKETVTAIRHDLFDGRTGSQIAKHYGVSESYVSAVKHGKLRPHG